jgi:hypothetical protein
MIGVIYLTGTDGVHLSNAAIKALYLQDLMVVCLAEKLVKKLVAGLH